jgi:BMFP domain-containing protein YqiC
MPIPVLMLTQDEYDGILARLAALEAALPTRSSETEGLALRVQSLESTLSAFAKTVADLPRQVTTKEKAGT